MHIVFAFRTIAMFSYHERTITTLVEHGHRVQLVVDPARSRTEAEPYTQEAVDRSGGLFSTGYGRQRTGLGYRIALANRNTLSYAGHVAHRGQSHWSKEAWRSRMPPLLRKAARIAPARWLMASLPSRALMRGVERVMPPVGSIRAWLEEQKPDVVVASPANIYPWGDVEYLKAARSLGIPTAVAVLSWDNLTARGAFPVKPDMLLAWNETQSAEARYYSEVPAERIVITGSPFFDKWVGAEPTLDRDAFCAEAGLPAEKPFVLYMGSSANIAKDEAWLLDELAAAFAAHEDPAVRDTQILFRPHPGNFRRYEGYQHDRIVLWPKHGTFPDSSELKAQFVNSLYHSIGTVSVNTSGILDALINGKPCIAVMLDQYRVSQEQTVHFKQLLEERVIQTAESVQECADQVAGLAAGDDPTAALRPGFIRRYIRPRDEQGWAGAVAARAIESLAAGKSPAEIDRELDSTPAQGRS